MERDETIKHNTFMRGNRVHPGVALTGQSTVPRITFTMQTHQLARIAVCLWLAASVLIVSIVFAL